jgi:hypothetical protein
VTSGRFTSGPNGGNADVTCSNALPLAQEWRKKAPSYGDSLGKGETSFWCTDKNAFSQDCENTQLGIIRFWNSQYAVPGQ